MIRTCPNCANDLRFDPALNKLSCDCCGGAFDVSEFDAIADGYEENDVVTVTSEDETGEEMECKIYTCSSCGAQISMTDTEASTFCVFCGNPTIVFSRISRVKRPQKIIPFVVTKQEAEAKIRERMKAGFFIPPEVKDFNVELLRGIYIPYYVTDISYADSAVLSSRVKSGKHTHTRYFLRTARCRFNRITTDGSNSLNDHTSERLEPFDYTGLRDFDEDYLSGFYADIADVEPDESRSTAANRARKLFEAALMDSIHGSNKKILHQNPKYKFNGDQVTAMFPAWFLTFRYLDKPYTVLVNGQTGKIVGGVPWAKAKFNAWLTALVVGLSVVMGFICMFIVPAMLSSSSHSDSKSGNGIGMIVVGAILAFSFGFTKLKKVRKAIERSAEETLTKYVSKRQKGE